MKHYRPLFILLVLVLWGRPALAWDFSIKDWEFTLDATDTFKYFYHFDNDRYDYNFGTDDNEFKDVDDQYHQFYNTLDVNLSHGDFRLGFRLDLNYFANTFFDSECDGDTYKYPKEHPTARWDCPWAKDRFNGMVVPERIFFIVARPEFDLTLGDFYVSLGKGIALNVVKLDELGQDNAIRGGKITVHHQNLELTLLGGQFNFLDVDEATGWNAPWPSEPVVAGRVAYRFVDTFIVGAHSVFIPGDAFIPPNKTDMAYVASRVVGGVGFEVPALWDDRLGFGAEVNLLGRVNQAPSATPADPNPGLAIHASTSLTLEDLTLLGEFKYYDGFMLAAVEGKKPYDNPYVLSYHQAPTLEWIRAEIANNHSVTGGRLRGDYNFGELGQVELTIFANYGFFRNWANEELGKHDIHNPFGGLELLWMDGEGQLTITGGLRRETAVDDGQTYLTDGYVEVELEQALTAGHSLKFSGTVMSREKYDTNHPWEEVELTLGYKWSPYLGLSLTYERYSKSPANPLTGELGLQADYFSGSARYYITPGTYINVRVGQSRPGIKCLNGSCRLYAAFSGVEATFVARFSDLNDILP